MAPRVHGEAPREPRIRGEAPKEPHCPHFGSCGGCSLLDRPYAFQLERKESAVASAFAGHPELAGSMVEDIVPALHPRHYRSRLLYPLARRGGRVVGGFFQRGTHELVDVHTCELQDPAITSIANRVRAEIERLDVPVRALPGVESDPTPPATSSALRALAVRVAQGSGDVLVGFVTTGGVFPRARELAEAAVEAGRGLETAAGRRARVVSVVRNLNDLETNVVLGRRTFPLLGRDHLVERLGGLRFRVSLGSFFQPNPSAARLAVRELTARAGSPRGIVVDAYAGVGVLALTLAREAREVIAIEESPAAARDGAASARDNRLTNVRFVEGRVEDRLPVVAAEQEIDLLVLDPPRGGLSPAALEAVLAARPRRIAYLSCSPTSLARDVASLARGFELKSAVPFDFLPHTEHVEVLAMLDSRS
jgi:23S rRNA (uracil1939-C5)-methyltransferase